MSTPHVVQLRDYRSRRQKRLREIYALHGADAERTAVIRQLGEVLEAVRADRAAAVWVDEYGPGLIHVHSLIDLVGDRPRRRFGLGPLKGAWGEGIPGLLDLPELNGSPEAWGEEWPRSQAVVSLGSDGTRAWFIVADSRAPRGALSRQESERFMFAAGDCAGILLHRDLPDEIEGEPEWERLRRERFTAWPVLQDVEGREADPGAGRRISCRFMVARVVRRLIEDDFASDRDALGHQIRGVRRELETASGKDAGDGETFERERGAWERVLEVAERPEDLRGLAEAVLALGGLVEEQGHLYGARELHRCAYDVAVAGADLGLALDALRFHARSCRKLGEFESAEYWYDRAMAVAEVLDARDRVAVVLSGLVGTHRERGNLLRARELAVRELAEARESGDSLALAVAYHDRLAIEKQAGVWDQAVVFGWRAFQAYPEESHRMFVLSDLAWTFALSGSLEAARNAARLAYHRSPESSIRVSSLECFAYTAAVRGRREEFEAWVARSEAEERGSLRRPIRIQVDFYRGLALEALGDLEAARGTLRRVLGEAREARLHQLAFQAETRLDGLEGARDPETTKPLEDPGDGEVTGILQRLSEMSETLAPV